MALVVSHGTLMQLRRFTESKSKNKLPMSAAVKLVNAFVHGDSRKSTAVRERLKVMARVMNGKHTKFGFVAKGLIKKYNAKPFVARTSTSFHHEPGVLFGIDIDVHVFSYAARKGLHSMKDTLTSAVFDLGFVVEGRENRELPEQMLCAARLSKVDLDAFCDDSTQLLTKRFLAEKSKK